MPSSSYMSLDTGHKALCPVSPASEKGGLEEGLMSAAAQDMYR